MGGDVHWDYSLQSLDVRSVCAGRALVGFLRLTQFFAHIAAEVFIRHLHLPGHRVFKAQTAAYNLTFDSFGRFAQLLCKIFGINAAKLVDAGNYTVLDILGRRFALLVNHTAAENISLAVCNFLCTVLQTFLLDSFKCGDARIVYVIVAQPCNVLVAVEVAVMLHKLVVCRIETVKQWLESCIVIVLGLILQNVCKRALNLVVVIEDLCLCMSFDFVGVDAERNGATHAGNAEFSVAVKYHTAFLNTLAEGFIDAHGLIFSSFNALLTRPIFFGKTFDPCGHTSCLVGSTSGKQTHRGRSVAVSLLKTEKHLAAHVFRVLNEIAVNQQGQVFGFAVVVCVCYDLGGHYGAHVNGMGTAATVHALADNDDVRSCGCAAECLIVHTEHADNVCIALLAADEPIAEFLRLVKCAA